MRSICSLAPAAGQSPAKLSVSPSSVSRTMTTRAARVPPPVRITIRDALILQSFRPDYPVQGNKTKQFEQIGNAIPPRLAGHLLRSLI